MGLPQHSAYRLVKFNQTNKKSKIEIDICRDVRLKGRRGTGRPRTRWLEESDEMKLDVIA